MISRRTFTQLLRALLALTVVVVPACGSSNPTSPSAVTVVAFGDSLTVE